jgi:hypothetical protein
MAWMFRELFTRHNKTRVINNYSNNKKREIMIKKFTFTLYLGLNDKDTKTQKIATVEAYKLIK